MPDTDIVPMLVRTGRTGDVVHRAGCFHVRKSFGWAWSFGRTRGEVRVMIERMELRACADCPTALRHPEKVVSMDMPDNVREQLEASFAKAEELELDPEWHDDRCGFSYDCISCSNAGRDPHRANMRFEAVAMLPITLLRFEAPSGQRHDSTGGRATGPAA